MPLYKTLKVNETTKVLIWKIEESIEILNEGIELTENCQNRVDGMKSELHKRGFMSIRHLLAEAGYVDSDLYYDELGKPHLKDGNYISITHSFTFTGIIISKSKLVGIDIEKQRDKIVRIAHKFTTVDDYKNIENEHELVRKLTIVWGAKESLYKIYEQEGLSFLQHIYVDDFTLEDTETTATITYKKKKSTYRIYFLEFEGFMCTYALDEVIN
ncbi:4'-phosphopantetheinyl transferase superfamily protein [Aureibaculum sp. 2210JD6-5]|uniref:4'-phosphopantetheinyl transferase family protein n=1 Tax=Aureibaculum sp. 2210JD6-5 TaxID=3103957 RepID=UPI002AAE7D81|nr:4'-phosphopantetheinyl transferase superfamily protein [Aureibaculum sp. 2210JD6-5]MDY7394788.1 4'-phosphopantetheinyl transferase superfamily protein [Aureibaculum sp. 2210JD6-5]